MMSSACSHLYSIPASRLRFFTVFGPWGSPEMALWRFTEEIPYNKLINVFAEEKLLRAFTYIDDIVGTIMVILKKHGEEALTALMNIGNNKPVIINELVKDLDQTLGRKAQVEYLPFQLEDVNITSADIEIIRDYSSFVPRTSLTGRLRNFCAWYQRKSIRT